MDWVLSSELLGLKGMPQTPRGITKKAKAENWVKRRKQGVKGNVLEYAISNFPPEIQAALQEKQLANIMHNTPALPESVKAPAKVNKKSQQLGLIPIEQGLQHLDDKQRSVADARLALVSYVLSLHQCEQLKLGIKESVRYVVEQIELGTLPNDKMHFVAIANARTGKKQQGLSFPTLYRWVRAYRAVQGDGESLRIGRILALADKKTRQPENLGDKVWLGDFLKHYQNPNKPTIVSAMRKMAVEYAKWGKEMPSYDMVQLAVKRLPPYVKNRGRVTGSEYKSKYLTHLRRDWLMLSPNDVWVGDGHSFKALVRSYQNGQPKTLEFTMVIDGCSGAIMGWSVSLAENTSAVADALRVGFRQYGLPLIYYSDNGAGQTAKLLDDETMGLFARLNIEHMTGIPGNPMGRSRIERKWQDTAIDLARDYPTFQGKNADSETVRKRNALIQSAWNAEKQGKSLTPEQANALKKVPTFQQFLTDLANMVQAYNETHEHSALPKDPETGKHYTPMAYYRYRLATDAPSEVAIEHLSELELDYLARPEVKRKVDMNAEINWLNQVYFHKHLLDYQGQEVRVGVDFHDASNVIVRTLDGDFICKAVLGGNVVPAFAKNFIEHQQEKRTQRKIRDLERKAEIARSEMQPALEQMPDFTAIMPNFRQPEPDFAVLPAQSDKPKTKKPIFNFDWEREEWEQQQKMG